MKAVLEDMWINACQVTDHFLGWNRLPLHHSRRRCWYCPPDTTIVHQAKKMTIIPIAFPTDAEYEQQKNSDSTYHTKRCIWIGSSYDQSVSWVKEWLFTLNRANYKVTNCQELGVNEPVVQCKQLIIFHLDSTWTWQNIRRHTTAAQRAVVIVKESWFQPHLDDKNIIWFVINDQCIPDALRRFNLILLKFLYRCTVRQYLQKSEELSLNQNMNVHCHPDLLDCNLML